MAFDVRQLQVSLKEAQRVETFDLGNKKNIYILYLTVEDVHIFILPKMT